MMKKVKREVTGFVLNLDVAGDLFLLSIGCLDLSDCCDILPLSVNWEFLFSCFLRSIFSNTTLSVSCPSFGLLK